MARATKWTDEKIKALKLPADKAEQRVLVEPGLYLFLRQRAGGDISKQWQYRAQVDGVRRWLSLGAYPGVGLAKAKADLLTHQATHEAAKKGEADHPALVERNKRKEAKGRPTVTAVFEEWIAEKRLGSPRKGGAPVRERTVYVLTQNFDSDVRDRIGEAKIDMLGADSFRACIDAARKRKAPGAAAQVYRTLRGLVLFAIKRGYLQADPMRGIDNPKPYRPAPVNAANDAELVALLHAVDASRLNESTKLAIEFQILTGARPTEARLATWAEFNLKRHTWVIPADRVKSGREFKVHLSKPSLLLLERAKAISDGKNPFVFPGIGEDAPMEKMAVARALSRLAERTEAEGGKKLKPHDLRRTFRTLLSRLGVQPHIAELCMNHQETETMRRVYDGHDYFGEMADAWDRAGAHLAALRKGSAQVIEFKKPAA
jgi:integrase